MTTTFQTECLPVAHIVDDDEPFRQSLTFLLESSGWSTVEYDSAAAFLAADPPYPGAGCLILDIRMPRMNGLELYQELVCRGSAFPVLFMTGHGDVELAVEAMKAGATDFLQKPFREQQLLTALESAHRHGQMRRRLRDSRQQAQDRLARLTPREYEIACLAAAGHPNKRIAIQLGISEKTVHSHRLNLMDKTGAGNLADLVRLVMSAAPEALNRQAESGQPLQLG